jgi:heme/copper-type cytochrome/quinol oxidase subunit 3
VNLFHQLKEKPWATTTGTVVDLHDGSAFSVPAATLGLRVFLVVVTVLFSLLIMAYGSRMTFEDWRPAPPLGPAGAGAGVCLAGVIPGSSWSSSASDPRSVNRRSLRTVTTFTWYVEARAIVTKRARVR